MLNRSHFLIALALAAIAACATSAASETADTEPAALSDKAQKTLDSFELTGDTRTCVPTRRIRSIKALSDDLLLVRVNSNDYYLNTPTSSCEDATKSSTALRYQIDGVPNLCTGETVNVISNRSGTAGLVLGGCALGDFQELERKPIDAATN